MSSSPNYPAPGRTNHEIPEILPLSLVSPTPVTFPTSFMNSCLFCVYSLRMKRLLILLWITVSACQQDRSGEELDLLSRLKSSSDLATVEVVFSKVVKGSKTSTFLGIPTGYSDFLAETEAIATAGIDLSLVRIGMIDWETGSISLILPPPKMISIEIPAESFRVNEEYTKDHYLSELESEDMDAFYRQAEREVRAEVSRMNLEQMARKKTETFLTGFLAKTGFGQVNFTYQSPSSDS